MEVRSPKAHKITAYLSPILAESISKNRRKGHIHVLSAFPKQLGENPRQKAGVLWHLSQNRLTVQYSMAPDHPGILGDIAAEMPIHIPDSGDRIRVSVALSCQKTPMSDVPEELRPALKSTPKPTGGRAYRSRLVIVPEAERVEWAKRKLESAGLDLVADRISVSKLHSISLDGKRNTIPYVDITATARVADAGPLQSKINDGMGKGKNYGLGMLRISPADSPDHIAVS